VLTRHLRALALLTPGDFANDVCRQRAPLDEQLSREHFPVPARRRVFDELSGGSTSYLIFTDTVTHNLCSLISMSREGPNHRSLLIENAVYASHGWRIAERWIAFHRH